MPEIDSVDDDRAFDGADRVDQRLENRFVDLGSVLFVPGAFSEGNANDNVARVAGAPDAFLDGGDCDLSEEPNGRFWSMGGGNTSLGVEGFFVGRFADTNAIVRGDIITVYEVGARDCSNIATARDDEYEI
jgi:hypothetical protein